ncbi:MAG: flavodoxin [Peptostreptococcaceae bacterium]|nr:flavodoxin [Peptostreptococcaceae bacterium]
MSKIAVIYWSQTGNTQMMAEAIKAGAESAGAEVALFEVSQLKPEDALAYDALALGCPAMGAEVLEENEFEPFFEAIENKLSGKKLALFGSYDWGDGEWMRNWYERSEKAGANLMGDEGLIVQNTPDAGAVEDCKAFGSKLANY